MADMKVPPPGLPVARPVAPARTEAIRAAQKAFFDAAMTQAQAPPTASTPARTQASERASDARPAATDTTQRYLRPGSRVDIKV